MLPATMVLPEGTCAPRKLVVAIHDVAPPFEREVRAELRMLAAVGVRRCVLKVVPNWHGSYPLPEAASFVALLRAELAAGSELVLHGLEHRRRGPSRGPWAGRLRAALFAGDAAEFLTLNPTEVGQAVREGLDLFARAGLPAPSTFCAPGWLFTVEAEQAIREAGMRWLIGMFSVRDLRTLRRRRVPGFGYMGAAPGQEFGVQILNRLVQRLAIDRATVAKVYLHPQGNLHSSALRWTLARLGEMVGRRGWRPATYAELCTHV